MALSKKAKCWKKTKLTLKICFAIYSIVVALIAYVNWKEKGADFSSTVFLWRRSPIVEFEYVSFDSATTFERPACSPGFVPADTQPSFPGATPFCRCGAGAGVFANSDLPDRTADVGTVCFANQTAAGCNEIGTWPAMDLTWRTTQLCVRRLGDSSNDPDIEDTNNALNRPRAFGTAGCPAGYTECTSNMATGTADTIMVDENTCVPDGEPCPFTSFQSVAIASPDPAGYECQAMGDGVRKMCGIRQGNVFPLVRFVFSQNATCFPSRLNQVSRFQSDFRNGEWLSCAKADSRWTTADTLNEDQIYTENSARLEAGNPGAASLDDTWVDKANELIPYVADFRGEPRWVETCPHSREKLSTLRDDVDRLTSAQLALLVLNILTGIFVNICYNCYEWRQDDDDGWDDDTKSQKRIRRCKLGCVIVVSLIKIIPLAIALGLSIRLDGIFKELADADCSDDVTNDTIRFFGDETGKQATLNILLLVGVVLEICLEVFSCYKSCKAPKDT